MRNKGSCRFEPYYKIQTWEAASLAWRDIQRAYPTAEAAQQGYPVGARCRLMRITEAGRAPVSSSDTGGA
jgi:hypothetical protein